MTKQITAALALGLTLASAAASSAQAAPMHKTMAHQKMTGRKMAAAGVYVCKDCKEKFTPAQAKKMGYKDGMGHKLTKMSKAPAGFTDGSKSKM